MLLHNFGISFFASGRGDLAALVSALERHGVSGQLPVFEYGCGVGRVTAHLARAFPHVTACDISASHLEMAQQVVGTGRTLHSDWWRTIASQ